jgi:holo-[acyl-carrier protein] synthase
MIRIFQGIDLVPVSKIKEIMLRRPQFGEEIFTTNEREYCLARPDPYIHFAGRFAAKEAFLKALGTGLSGNGIDGSLSEIEVVPGRGGRPELSISGWAARIGSRKKINQFTVSISHSGDFAVASVILSAGDSGYANDKGWAA